MRTPLTRALTVVGVSAAYIFVTEGGVFNASFLGDIVADYGPAYFAALWVSEDARSTKYWPAYHYGLFLFVFAIVAVPHYVVHTRGRRGALPALGWLVFLLVPSLASYAGWWLYYDLPDFRG